MQGDVVAIYNESGKKIGTYTYDAWGATTYTTLSRVGVELYITSTYNPFRYRGYYYDTDSGWYYLQSRYYDARWGRFINSDGQLNNDMLGSNMFSYCSNNPVMRVDHDGHGWWIPACAIVGGAVGALAKIVTNIATGEDLNDGVLGAAAGGAMYGGVLAATGNIAAAGFASAATESLVNEVTSYIPGVSTLNGAEQKSLDLNNVTNSIATVVVDTLVDGTINTITGELAASIIPTNNGWFKPKKFLSSFCGKYAVKSELQTLVQAGILIAYNTLDYYFGNSGTQPEEQNPLVVICP